VYHKDLDRKEDMKSDRTAFDPVYMNMAADRICRASRTLLGFTELVTTDQACSVIVMLK
jgi:hypothetical protein